MCSNNTVPPYLHKNGHPVVGKFDEDELVFRRYEKNPVTSPDGRAISSLAFRLENDSYNRSRFCQDYRDVLYDEIRDNDKYFFENWGVVEFPHSAFNKIYKLDNPKDTREFYISIVHSPRECMYPHCHQIAIVDSAEVEIPKSIKAKIREHIKDIHRVVKLAA